MSGRHVPPSYWLGRAIVVVALAGTLYLIWSTVALTWPATADRWLDGVADWTGDFGLW
jgi:hypothetical protein